MSARQRFARVGREEEDGHPVLLGGKLYYYCANRDRALRDAREIDAAVRSLRQASATAALDRAADAIESAAPVIPNYLAASIEVVQAIQAGAARFLRKCAATEPRP